jgi:hypothetical protein
MVENIQRDDLAASFIRDGASGQSWLNAHARARTASRMRRPAVLPASWGPHRPLRQTAQVATIFALCRGLSARHRSRKNRRRSRMNAAILPSLSGVRANIAGPSPRLRSWCVTGIAQVACSSMTQHITGPALRLSLFWRLVRRRSFPCPSYRSKRSCRGDRHMQNAIDFCFPVALTARCLFVEFEGWSRGDALSCRRRRRWEWSGRRSTLSSAG